METFDVISKRQSVGESKPDPVPRELIEKLLSAYERPVLRSGTITSLVSPVPLLRSFLPVS
jgi:hypothetical protein